MKGGLDVLAIGFTHTPIPALGSMLLYSRKGVEVSLVERHGVLIVGDRGYLNE